MKPSLCLRPLPASNTIFTIPIREVSITAILVVMMGYESRAEPKWHDNRTKNSKILSVLENYVTEKHT